MGFQWVFNDDHKRNLCDLDFEDFWNLNGFKLSHSWRTNDLTMCFHMPPQWLETRFFFRQIRITRGFNIYHKFSQIYQPQYVWFPMSQRDSQDFQSIIPVYQYIVLSTSYSLPSGNLT